MYFKFPKSLCIKALELNPWPSAVQTNPFPTDLPWPTPHGGVLAIPNSSYSPELF